MMLWDDRFILAVAIFIMIMILILVIGGVVFFIKIVTSGKRKPGKTSEPLLEILKTRYAKGEISRDEYEQIRKDIF